MHGFFNRSLSWSWDETSPRAEPASIFMKSHQRAVKRAESRRQLTLSSTLKKKSFTQTSIKIDDGAWELVIKRDRARLVNSFSVDSVFNTPCCFYSKSVYLNVDNFLTSLCWFLIALPIKSKYVWERIVSFFFFLSCFYQKKLPYPLDGYLSSGYRYSSFEQPEPDATRLWKNYLHVSNYICLQNYFSWKYFEKSYRNSVVHQE